MKITIVGGGNIGTIFAVHCAEKEHEVTVFTSDPGVYDNRLNIVDENGNSIHEGIIKQVTNEPAVAFKDADMIIVTYPAMMMEKIAEEIYANAGKNAMIGVVPGSGGSECAFRKCIERGNVFFGFERVPSIARLVIKGKTVQSKGYKSELHIASIPSSAADKCCLLMQEIFDIPCKAIPNYLNITLTPSNPILHTTRLCTIFKDYHNGVIYPSLPLFYEEWDDPSSELLLSCDDEEQRICRALPEFQLSHVVALREYYESPTAQAMTKKISSINAFKGLTTPCVKVDEGFIPDLHSRYFTADFSYGLTIIQQIAAIAGIDTPNIDNMMEWYRNIAVEKNEFRLSDYNINNIDDMRALYLI
ncbi:NAD/NADP octopine/nopaline dehydrogenase family protein [Ruminococcus sp.]